VPAPLSATPRRRPRDRKQQILVAARDLFAEQGFPNVTMVQIADSVGITAGALYRHFNNKAVLLEQVIAQSFDWLNEPLPALDYASTIDRVLALFVDRPHVSDLWLHEVRYLPDDKLRDLRGRAMVWNQSLTPAIRERRPTLDAGQQALLAWAVQSLIACVGGRRALHAPTGPRLGAVRAALEVVIDADLRPTGGAVDLTPRLAPRSMRERLLLAAIEQFGQRGYHETSLASIGAAAHVTGPNLYGYFGSKADLLRAVLERGTHSLWVGLHAALGASRTPEEALRRFVDSDVSPGSSWIAILEDPVSELDIQQAADATHREYVDEWAALLRQVLPQLDLGQARVRVQLALLVVSDLHRSRRLARDGAFQDNLRAIVLALLLDDRIPDGAV
jgi:AcrR family transcriptional regulator